MAIGTLFIVYERAVVAGPRDGEAAIGKWRDEEAGHNSMEASGGTTVIPSPIYATPCGHTDAAKCCKLPEPRHVI